MCLRSGKGVELGTQGEQCNSQRSCGKNSCQREEAEVPVALRAPRPPAGARGCLVLSKV